MIFLRIWLAGIVGNAGNALVDKCYNTGNVNGVDLIGGITGGLYNGVQLQNCYNTGNVNGDMSAGGIVGINQHAEVINCYNTGDVKDGYIIGGIAGNNQGKCSNCYNIGNISGTTRVGGIAGQLDTTNAILKNSYSLEGKCENVIGANLNGAIMESSSIKSESEMKALAPVLGSAFKEDTNNTNNGYPLLQWQ